MNLRSYLSILLFATFVVLVGLVPVTGQDPKSDPTSTGSISGRITIDGKPRAGLNVELTRLGPDGFHQATVMSVQTSKTGRYIFRGVQTGTYDVSSETPNVFVPTDGRFGYPGKNVVIEPGETVTEINLEMVSKGTITGRVTDSFGRPVVGQAVEYLLKREEGWLQPLSLPQPSDRSTNSEGVYRTPGLPPGRYVVKVGVPYGFTATVQQTKSTSTIWRPFILTSMNGLKL